MSEAKAPRPNPTGRLSLTRRQIATDEGAELLRICVDVAQDGRLDDDEIQTLAGWLDAGTGAGFAGAAYLREVIERAMADHHVSDAERVEIQLAIERVLPPEYREIAQRSRRSVQQAEQARAKIARDAANASARERNSPLAKFDFMVAGVTYGKRQHIIQRLLFEGQDVILLREPNNPVSSNAIAITTIEGEMIGYVPELDAIELAESLDNGFTYVAWVKKILASPTRHIPVILIYIYQAGATVEGGRHSQTPRSTSPAAPDAPARPALPRPSTKWRYHWLVRTGVGIFSGFWALVAFVGIAAGDVGAGGLVLALAVAIAWLGFRRRH